MDATETAVKHAKLDQYRVVYFATHGLVSGDLDEFAKGKVEPALALTIPDQPTDDDDGLLTASEIDRRGQRASARRLTGQSIGIGAAGERIAVQR